MSDATAPRLGAWRIASAVVVFLLAACSEEKVGDFTYHCVPGGGIFDGRSCEIRLTDRYLLRYGEGTGDRIVLAFGFDQGGSAGLIGNLREGDFVRRIGLDERLLVVQTYAGDYFVAPAHTEQWPSSVGPLTADEFAAGYPNAPAWKAVQ